MARVFRKMPNGRLRWELVDNKKPKKETASIEPPETAMKPKPKAKSVGGGWYELEDGSKVRKSELEGD